MSKTNPGWSTGIHRYLSNALHSLLHSMHQTIHRRVHNLNQSTTCSPYSWNQSILFCWLLFALEIGWARCHHRHQCHQWLPRTCTHLSHENIKNVEFNSKGKHHQQSPLLISVTSLEAIAVTHKGDWHNIRHFSRIRLSKLGSGVNLHPFCWYFVKLRINIWYCHFHFMIFLFYLQSKVQDIGDWCLEEQLIGFSA